MSTRKIILELTPSEARGLWALAGEGAEGILTDEGAARDFIGNHAQQEAARRGYEKLGSAIARLPA